MDLVAGVVAAVGTAYNFYQLTKIEQQADVSMLPTATANGEGAQAAVDQNTVSQPAAEPCAVQQDRVVVRGQPCPCDGNRARQAVIPAQVSVPAPASNACEKRQLRSGKKIPQAIAPKLSRVSKNRRRPATPKIPRLTQQRPAAVRCARTCRPGKVTKNAFFNFIREVRVTRCGQRQADVVKEAACRWNRMSCEEKLRYNRDNVVKRK